MTARQIAFSAAYWLISIAYTLMAALSALAPGRAATRWVIRHYIRRMVQAMRLCAGVRIEAQGRQRLPKGAFILAAKHQSWGDGFAIYSQFDDLAFVTGDHLERFPLMGTVLRKLGAIVVNNCGGPEARRALIDSAAQAKADNRRILIFPEGHLSKAGERFRYRTGVFHMYRDFDMPVVPVATNLGLFWPQQSFQLQSGTATIEFLDPIPTGLSKAEFMARLEQAVEDRSQSLIAEATGKPVKPSVLVPTPDERRPES
ncbi:MAG: lysophospholipid acyltransferase family protein [Caulobacteraceae bacterium]